MTVNTEFPPLSLRDFLADLGRFQVMEPDTEEVMVEAAERAYSFADIARGQHWHTSLHASSFPGDDPDACPRLLAYGLMDFSNDKPMPPWVTTCGDVGKAGELSIARAWYDAGRLLATPDDLVFGKQLVFEDPDHWMSGSVDLPILKRGWRKPHICEIKFKADDVIEKMLKGERKWDPAHRRQLLASLGLANAHDWGTVTVCSETWRQPLSAGDNPFLEEHLNQCRAHGGVDCLVNIELEPPDTGSLYYASRSWPRKTVEFFFTHDDSYMEQGLTMLDDVREHFLRDEIPPRPDHFQWSLGACRYCPMKPGCRDDFGRKKADTPVTVLSESSHVERTKKARPDYDPSKARDRVIGRWNGRD